MSAATQSNPSWCERIFNALDFKPEDTAPEFAFEDRPKWVKNVLVELMQQTCPSVRLRRFGETTPRKLGLYLGQQCANAYALGAVCNVSPEKASIGKEKLKVLEANRGNAAVQSLLNVLGIVQKLSARWVEWFPQFEKVLHDAFREALDQPSHEDAVSFFEGFAKGISKPGLKNGAATLGTTATLIYQKLFFTGGKSSNCRVCRNCAGFSCRADYPSQCSASRNALRSCASG
jgi:hypothetical protein